MKQALSKSWRMACLAVLLVALFFGGDNVLVRADVFAIIEPGAGTVWRPGQKVQFTWRHSVEGGYPVKSLTFSIMSGQSAAADLVTNVASGVDPNVASLDWTVPVNFDARNDYFARITGIGDSGLSYFFGSRFEVSGDPDPDAQSAFEASTRSVASLAPASTSTATASSTSTSSSTSSATETSSSQSVSEQGMKSTSTSDSATAGTATSASASPTLPAFLSPLGSGAEGLLQTVSSSLPGLLLILLPLLYA